MMNRSTLLAWSLAAVLPLALPACGGKAAPVEEPEEPVDDEVEPPPPPPPPPVCVQAGAELSQVGLVEADAEAVRFCVSDGAASNLCYGVALETGTYRVLDEPPRGQPAALEEAPAKVETTPTEVKVCLGETCSSIKPPMPKGSDNPIDAVANAGGTVIAVLKGNAEKGKGVVEVWAAGGKKPAGTIKYPRGAFKCGEARVLGDTVYVSANDCNNPTARGALYSTKGKKLADVGGAEFGTYGAVPVQVSETAWAFLDETGRSIAVHDVTTGALDKTIDVASLWAAEVDGAAVAGQGGPGESALARGAEGTLVVVTGGPGPGTVGVVDLADGALASSVAALPCPRPAADSAPADAAAEDDGAAEDADAGGE